ncbi:MAG: HD domain-containing protein [Hyphomicrobiales bacterium]|nr:HD domain-containing protein [Hyphomicrobiales bacterium]
MTDPDLSRPTANNIVAFIGDIFERREEEYLGEPFTLAGHMLQTANIAENNGQEEIIVGALLHDIGHFTSEFGTFTMDDQEDKFHEEAGAKVLAEFIPPVVTDCVHHYVAAKRCLCAKNSEYHTRLSAASVYSLYLQGGPMEPGEVREFKRNPNLAEIIEIRCLDDAGKRAGMKTPDFWHFAPMVQCLSIGLQMHNHDQ